MKILFSLTDITPQLDPKTIKVFEHAIWMAKELDEPQMLGGIGLVKPIIIWPSGKMSFVRRGCEV